MGKSSAPPPPDYAALAQSQGAENIDAARITNRMNRINEVTPDGSRRYELTNPGQFDEQGFGQAQSNYLDQIDRFYSGELNERPRMPTREDFMVGGDPDSYTLTTELSPVAQQRRNIDDATALAYSSLGIPAVDRAAEIMGERLDSSSIPQLEMGGDQYNDEVARALYDRTMTRVQPQMRQQRDDLTTQLSNMGLTRGSEAWDREMANLQRGETDQLNDLGMRSTLAGGAEGRANASFRNSAIGQQLAQLLQLRTQPLNEINSIRSGSQIAAPNFSSGVYQGANVAAAPTYQAGSDAYSAALDAYRTRSDQSNAALGALGTIGGSFVGGPMGAAAGRALASRIGMS